MNTNFQIDGNKVNFFLENEGHKLARIETEIKDKLMFANHTEVDKLYEGQGLAAKLFDEMVRYARENSLQVKAVCPYILNRFKRKADELNDVWYNKE